ncbi:MAG: Ig-like domain-containing protein [Bacillaceae bacterium]
MKASAAPSVNSVTKNTTVMAGKTEKKAIVTAKVGEKVIGTTMADKNGKFEMKISKQKAGIKISVTATDSASNVSKATVTTVK